MESITNWACALIACALIASLTDWLTQDTALTRTVRFVLGGFLLCALVLPMVSAFREMKNTLPAFSAERGTMTDFSGDLTAYEDELLRTQVSELIRKTLSEEGLPPSSVQVEMTVTDEGEISHLKADVLLPSGSASDCLRACSLLQNKLGIEGNVHMEKDG